METQYFYQLQVGMDDISTIEDLLGIIGHDP